MVRAIGFIIGLGFVFVALFSFGTGAYLYVTTEQEEAAHHGEAPMNVAFSFDGPFGRYDPQQLQRGFQVFKEVCASCHGLNFVAFRNLQEIGYSEAAVDAIADQWQIQVPSIHPETGEATGRNAIASDRFPDPYPNETAARMANANSFPPDLSLITKARHGGAAYVYSLLLGYEEPPHGEEVPEGLHYNRYFPNLNTAMPPPITADGQVTYAPGNPAPTREQMALDVSAFLMWTAEPNLQRRHASGIVALIFLIFATGLGYLAYRNVWANAKRKVRITGPLDPVNQAKSDAAKDDAGVAG